METPTNPVRFKVSAQVTATLHVQGLVDGLGTHLHPLYAVLDGLAAKPWGVEGTTLSKVLHRKRPQSLVLHDRWVRACYVGGDGPVPRAQERS